MVCIYIYMSCFETSNQESSFKLSKKRFRMWYDRSHLVHGAKVLLFPDEGAE